MKIFQFITLLFFITSIAFSQHSNIDYENIERVKIYLDCEDCDPSFFRKNLEQVSFVRTPKLSDIHILITEQRNGVGGTEYGINFIGSGIYSDLRYKLKTVSLPFESKLVKWDKILKTIELGLLPFLSQTNYINDIDIHYNGSNKILNNNDIYDPWHSWVFRLGLSTFYEAEETQNELSLRSTFDANKITESFKSKTRFTYYFNQESYEDEEDIINITKEEAKTSSEFVYSLNSRWSIGVFGNISKSSFLNLELASKIGPAIEYNIFPWDSSDRKVFTIAYRINAHNFKYIEPTIYNKMSENRFSQSVRIAILLRQQWGNFDSYLKWSNYFFDFSKNRLSSWNDISINISRGLSIFSNIEIELIHDQLYLPSSEATLEELLLQQRQLETNFDVSINLGIRFTFGSIYNNIINHRL